MPIKRKQEFTLFTLSDISGIVEGGDTVVQRYAIHGSQETEWTSSHQQLTMKKRKRGEGKRILKNGHSLSKFAPDDCLLSPSRSHRLKILDSL